MASYHVSAKPVEEGPAGRDARNGFHDVILDNFSFHGERVTEANLGRFFSENDDVWGLGFTAPPECVSAPGDRACVIAPAAPPAPILVGRPSPP